MKINSTTRVGNFKIEDEGKEFLELKYENWFSNTAKADFNNKKIEIKPKNFWKTSFDIFHNGTDVGDITFNWISNAIITINNEIYLLRAIELWKLNFELLDKNEDRILLLKPSLKWKKMKYDYEIELITKDYEINQLLELLIYVGFGANLYMTATIRQ